MDFTRLEVFTHLFKRLDKHFEFPFTHASLQDPVLLHLQQVMTPGAYGKCFYCTQKSHLHRSSDMSRRVTAEIMLPNAMKRVMFIARGSPYTRQLPIKLTTPIREEQWHSC